MPETVSVQSKLSFAGTTGTYTNVTTTDSFEAALGTSARGYHATQSIGLTVEEIVTGDVTRTANYWVRIENKDTTNTVTINLRTASAPTDNVMSLIRPGEMFGPVRMVATGTGSYSAGYPFLTAIASTAACNVEVVAVDG